MTIHQEFEQLRLHEVTFSCERFHPKLEDVIDLRLRAYNARRQRGLPNSRNYARSDLTDAFDERAYLVVGERQGAVVASLRINAPSAGEAWEFERYFPFPVSFPSRHRLVEITRVCVDRAFRTPELSTDLFRYAAFVIPQLGRDHLIGSSSPGLFRLYQRIGCKDTGVTFDHPFNGKNIVFSGDVRSGLLGNLHPFIWSLVYSDIAAALVHRRILRPRTPIERVTYMLQRFAKPLATRAARAAIRRVR